MSNEYTLTEIEATLKKEGIGRSSTRYVIEELQKIQKTPAQKLNPVELKGSVECKVQDKPVMFGVKVSPFSENHVTFEHNGERCILHFLTNGNLGLSRENNQECYLEIDKDQVMALLLSKI